MHALNQSFYIIDFFHKNAYPYGFIPLNMFFFVELSFRVRVMVTVGHEHALAIGSYVSFWAHEVLLNISMLF